MANQSGQMMTTGNAGGHVLCHLGAFLAAEFDHLLVVGLNLGVDRRAIHVTVLSLNDRNGSRRTSGTCGHDQGCPKDTE